jgi:glucose-6-phosphate isomerase
VANAKAQAKALVTREMPSDGFFNAVTTIRLDELTPRRLGALMAMYEHKTTMLAHLFGINAFDQPGVELGKRLSHQVESQF